MNAVMNKCASLMLFTLPFALESLVGRHTMNAAWDVLVIAFLYFYWVGTKRKTPEEVDFLFDGERPTQASELRNEGVAVERS